eukprot:1320095-Ditylum_brightwellii.AAC.1
MRHYALLRDGFSNNWQSNSITESHVATLEAAIIGLQAGPSKAPGDTTPEGGKWGDATLRIVHICSHCRLCHYLSGQVLTYPYKSLTKSEAKKKAKEWVKKAYPEDNQPNIWGFGDCKKPT